MWVVPARNGSKRLPFKNIKKINGYELWERGVLHGVNAVGTGVVTTDIPQILENSAEVNYSFYNYKNPDYWILNREEPLCTDEAEMLPVLQDAVGRHQELTGVLYDYVVLLQPTSPLRTVEDVTETIKLFFRYRPKIAYKGLYRNDQCLPSPDGTVYVYDTRWLMNADSIDLSCPHMFNQNIAVYHNMSYESIDVDTAEDFEAARAVLEGDDNEEEKGNLTHSEHRRKSLWKR
jgi:CMP-N-acetylneuraminic acid synthetase